MTYQFHIHTILGFRVDIHATVQIVTVKTWNHWQRFLSFLVLRGPWRTPVYLSAPCNNQNKTCKNKRICKQGHLLYKTWHQSQSPHPPFPTKKSTATNTTCVRTERHGILATAHLRSYLLLLVADSVNIRGPEWSGGAVRYTLCRNLLNYLLT